MGAHWENVYPNPDALELTGTFPGEEDAVSYNGLELVPLYDYEDQLVWYDTWELRLAKTGEPLMHIYARGREAAQEWATKIADNAPWVSLEARPDWFGPFVTPELRDFILANPATFSPPTYPTIEDLVGSGAAMPVGSEEGSKLEALVPYGNEG